MFEKGSAGGTALESILDLLGRQGPFGSRRHPEGEARRRRVGGEIVTLSRDKVVGVVDDMKLLGIDADAHLAHAAPVGLGRHGAHQPVQALRREAAPLVQGQHLVDGRVEVEGEVDAGLRVAQQRQVLGARQAGEDAALLGAVADAELGDAVRRQRHRLAPGRVAVVEGAAELLETLERRGLPYGLLTNDACHSPEEKTEYLRTSGVVVDADRFCSAAGKARPR